MDMKTAVELRTREASLAHGYLREDVREEMTTLAGTLSVENTRTRAARLRRRVWAS